VHVDKLERAEAGRRWSDASSILASSKPTIAREDDDEGDGDSEGVSRSKAERARPVIRVSGVSGCAGGGVEGDSSSGAPGSEGVRYTSFERSPVGRDPAFPAATFSSSSSSWT